MSERQRADRGLSRLLQAADPTRREPTLTALEVARLRRSVEAAWNGAARARLAAWLPALAVATAFLLVVGLAFVAFGGSKLGRVRPSSAPAGPARSGAASSRAASPAPSLPRAAGIPRVIVLTSGRRLARPVPLLPLDVAARSMSAAPPRDARRALHFTAPGGTRIVWDLGSAQGSPAEDGADARS